MAGGCSEATNREDLDVPFLFVPHGDPLPTEWMARHPGWVKFPATMVPRESQSASPPPAAAAPVAALGATALLAPATLEATGAFALLGVGGLLAAAAASLAAVGIYVSRRPAADPKTIDDLPLDLPPESGRRAGEGIVPPPPSPPLPGLVPPDWSEARLGLEGFTPSPPTPPLPGFTPGPPQMNALPGRPAEEQGATVVNQNRNDGLQGGARTSSQRARNAARVGDPAVTQALSDAEWRAHHLINLAAVRSAPDLLAAAVRAGWRTDDAGNVAPLPASPEAQQKLGATGIHRPVHDSGHRNWNDEVVTALTDIEIKLRSDRLMPGTDTYAKAARKELEHLQETPRRKMRDLDRLTENAPAVQHTIS